MAFPLIFVAIGLALTAIGCGSSVEFDESEAAPEPQDDPVVDPNCPEGLQGKFDNTQCKVVSNSDSYDDVYSLRHKLENFNRTGTRMCTDLIKFSASDFTIKLTDTLALTNAEDGDGDNCTDHDDPHNFLLDGAGAMVTLDATGLDPQKCAIELYNSGAVLKNLTIVVQEGQEAICDFGENNSYSPENGVEIILSE